MVKDKQLKLEDLEEKIDGSKFRNEIEIEIGDNKTICYGIRVWNLTYTLEGIKGYISIDKCLKEDVLERKKWSAKKTPKTKRKIMWSYFHAEHEIKYKMLLTNRSEPVKIGDDQINYKNSSICEGFQNRDYNDKTEDYESAPVMIKPAFFEELCGNIDKELIHIYNTITNKK